MKAPPTTVMAVVLLVAASVRAQETYCPSGWTKYSPSYTSTTFCYTSAGPLNAGNGVAAGLARARYHCETARGAQIASIHSDDENTVVKSSCNGVNACWIGLVDNVAPYYFNSGHGWTDGTPVDYVKWAEQRSSHEECTFYYQSSGWADVGCTNGWSTARVACKKEATTCPSCGTNAETVPPCDPPETACACKDTFVGDPFVSCVCPASTFYNTASGTCDTYTECVIGTTYETQPPGETDRVCTPVTTCGLDEYETRAPTYSADRDCDPLTVCEPGQVISVEATLVSDRTCSNCPAGTTDEDDDPTTACVDCGTTYNLGTYIDLAGTSGSCANFACQPPELDHDSDATTPCVDCGPGHLPVVDAGKRGPCDTLCCAAGEYDDGRTGCKDCPIGTESEKCAPLCSLCQHPKTDHDGNPSSPCVTCGPGTYLPPCTSCSGDCEPCAPGTYDHDGSPSTPCITCADGQFQPNFGELSCLDTLVCPEGYWEAVAPTTSTNRECSNIVRQCDTFGHADKSTCVQCRSGYFLESETSCQPCPEGMSCASGISADLCPNGEFQNSTGQTSCEPCPAGTTTKPHPRTSCLACPEGHRCPTATEIEPCPEGTFQSAPGQTVCLPCEAGTLTVAPPRTTCEVCPVGHACPDPNTKQPCGVGEFQDLERQTTCRFCAPGFLSTDAPRTGCDPCLPGYACPDAETQVPCGEGTYQDEPSGTTCKTCPVYAVQPTSTTTSCTNCTAGHSCNSTETQLEQPCPEGFHQPLSAQTSCVPCPAGQYQPNPGQATCKGCTNGTFSPMSAAVGCQSASVGFVAFASDNAFLGNDFEKPCALGHFCVNGIMNPCPKGSYQNEEGATDCLPCGIGSYGDSVGRENCTLVPDGFFGTGGSSAETSIAIERCKPGHYCIGGVETECAPGSGQPEQEKSSCHPCNLGEYQSESAQLDCTACPSGKFANETGMTTCHDTGAGFFATNNPQGKPDHQAICPTGNFCEQGIVQSCPQGTYQDEQGQEHCKDCGPGMYNEFEGVDRCQPIIDGLYGLGEMFRFVSVAVCSEGSFCTGGIEIPCPAGTYQPAQNSSGCLDCPDGFFSRVPGRTKCTSISLGSYGVNGSNAKAVPYTDERLCPRGHFCVGIGPPEPCPFATFQQRVGFGSCDACDTDCGVGLSFQSCNPVSGEQSCIDDIPPVITRNGPARVVHEAGVVYVDAGATCSDPPGTPLATFTKPLLHPLPTGQQTGTFVVWYYAEDSNGNEATPINRTIVVKDTLAPTVQIIGGNITVVQYNKFVDPWVTAVDQLDGDISNQTTVFGMPSDTRTPGTYTITYSISDAHGNVATAKRHLIVLQKSVEDAAVTLAFTEYQRILDSNAPTSDAVDAAYATYVQAGGGLERSSFSATLTQRLQASGSAASVPLAVIVAVVAATVVVVVAGAFLYHRKHASSGFIQPFPGEDTPKMYVTNFNNPEASITGFLEAQPGYEYMPGCSMADPMYDSLGPGAESSYETVGEGGVGSIAAAIASLGPGGNTGGFSGIESSYELPAHVGEEPSDLYVAPTPAYMVPGEMGSDVMVSADGASAYATLGSGAQIYQVAMDTRYGAGSDEGATYEALPALGGGDDAHPTAGYGAGSGTPVQPSSYEALPPAPDMDTRKYARLSSSGPSGDKGAYNLLGLADSAAETCTDDINDADAPPDGAYMDVSGSKGDTLSNLARALGPSFGIDYEEADAVDVGADYDNEPMPVQGRTSGYEDVDQSIDDDYDNDTFGFEPTSLASTDPPSKTTAPHDYEEVDGKTSLASTGPPSKATASHDYEEVVDEKGPPGEGPEPAAPRRMSMSNPNSYVDHTPGLPQTPTQALVTSLKELWWQPNATREEVMALLETEPTGSFVARGGTVPGDVAIAVRGPVQVWNGLIVNDSEGLSFQGSPIKASRLDELLYKMLSTPDAWQQAGLPCPLVLQ
eukprot:m.172896 g.172896  ORF g.172896 m.172896 type:complete len:1936 (-) comp17866_c0_seq1:81-5888(-)